MKKFFAGIAAAAIITVPMTSFALESMSKGALKKATAQAGVSIAIDNVVIYQTSQPTVTYWDTDGTSKLGSFNHDTLAHSYSHVGTVDTAGIKITYAAEAAKLITIGAILDSSLYGVAKIKADFAAADGALTDAPDIGIADLSTVAKGQKLAVESGKAVTLYTDEEHETALNPAAPAQMAADTYAGNATNSNFVNGISPLTIDVGTCQALTQGFLYNVSYNLGKIKTAAETNKLVDSAQNITGVVIGLPTVEIATYHSNDKKTISLATKATNATTDANIIDADPDAVSLGTGVGNYGTDFITIEKSGHSKMAILGGRLEIAPH